MTRHIGMFMQQTIKPILYELSEVLTKCKKLDITKKEMSEILSELVYVELQKTILQCTTQLVLGILFFITIYLILK